MPNDSDENLVPYAGIPSEDMTMELDITDSEVVDSQTTSTTPVETETKVDPIVEDEEDSTEEDESSELAKANKEMHLAMLDTIAEKFDDLLHNRITKEDLKTWLDKNALYHEKANKSKRLKDQYRTFMASLTPETQATTTTDTIPQGDIAQIVAQEVAKALAAKDQEKATTAFTKTIDTFASQKGLKGDTYTLFQTNVNALKSVHTTLPQDQILNMAYGATVPQKGNGIVLANQTAGTTVSTQEESIDLSKGYTFIDIPVNKR